MEATHDLDFILWCLEGRRPVRVLNVDLDGGHAVAQGRLDAAPCQEHGPIGEPHRPAVPVEHPLQAGEHVRAEQNVHAGADGRPWLIDPAAYGGHREVDQAMLSLFGAPGPAFGAACVMPSPSSSTFACTRRSL